MMRIRPILKRFTRKKIKKDKEIHRAANRKKVSIKSRFMTKLGFIKDKQKADNESDEYNREYATADLLVTTDEPGYVTVHVSADNTESASEKNTTEKLEPRESIGNALREESVKDTKPLGEKHTTDKLTPVEIPENELHINSTEDLKDNLLLRVPDRSVYKDLQRRSLDQLISDRSSGISRDSSLWSRKQFGYNRTASNVSIYSKQQHERADTRTVWTQTDISNTETVEKLVGPSPAESLDVKLEDIEPGPSPSGSTGFGVEPRFCFKQVENPKLAKIKNQILKRLTCPNLQTCEASICIELLKFPKLPFLIALNRKLSQEDALFNVEFLELNGLDYLLLLMDYIAEEGLADLVDVCHMVIVSECATSVVNSKAGREYLITHGEHIVSMAREKIRPDISYESSARQRIHMNYQALFSSKALETKNLMVKMQIFELLSALCVYSKDGYYLTLDALERYRSWQKLQYRMSLLVNELRKSELTTYRTTIMALINAIIFANENIRDRVRIRNEFISLNILDTIQTLRADDDDELNVQCDVFEEELNADSEAVENMNEGRVNVNDHLSVFSAILKRVQGTPLNATFLGILHTLLQIEPYSSHSESIWTLIERIAQEAIIKDPHEEGDQLIEKCKDQTKKQKDEGTQTDEVARTGSGILRRSLVNKSPAPRTSSGTFDQSSGSVPPPPPPIPTIQIGSQPPPPPPPPLFKQHSVPAPPPPPPSPGSKRMSANVLLPAGVPPAPPSPGGSVPPPPPPPPSPGMAPPPPPPPGSPVPPPPPGGMMSPSVQQGPPPPKAIETPDPGCKMKTINWNKIPAYAFKQDSVWSDVLKMNDSIDVEYGRLEELFSQKVTSPTAGTLSPEAEDNNKVMTRKNSNKDIEVTLLDPKKSMNVNIFLKQFRKANDVIVDLIKQGDARALGVEKLKGLLKLLPAQEEIEIIQGYEGDVDKLGNAEKFFHGLIQLKSYKFRIETMLLKADFNSQIGAVRPNIQVYNSVCRKLIDNKSLKSFLRFVLHAGNFLNKGSSAGNAIGFRISSLNKLVMTKSNVPRMTLLHHLVEEAEKKQKDSLAFVEDLLDLLQKASRFTLEGMLTEFNSLKTNVQRLKTQLEHVDQEVKDQFSSFMEEAENDIGDVEEAIGRVQKLSVRLANHYCENENSFKIDEFLEAFKEFCEKCKSCQQDLETWRINEEKAEQRRKTQAELAEKRRSGHGTLGLKVQEDRKIVDNLVNEIRKGKVLRRLSMRHKSQESKT